MKAINYQASRTGAKFHASNKVVRGFLGPVGNGKSVTCINELHRLAVTQEPNFEGIRKTKWAIIRNTTLELRSTTLQTFRQWLPDDICTVTMHPMIQAVVSYPLQDGTKVDALFLFLALDRPDDVKKLLSLEITGAFINEAREIPFEVVKAARERIGRYPAQVDGYTDRRTNSYRAPRDENGNYKPCTRKVLLMDTNPPDDDHWWYQLAEEGCLRDNKSPQARAEVERIFDFFRGPAPLIKEGDNYKPNPLAENIKFLPGGYQYYLDMIAGNTEDHINVMVLGNYGTIRTGRPVYPQYNDRIHCDQEVTQIIEDLPIALGWDFGLTPSVVIGQLTNNGQMRILAELVAKSMGVRQFARDVVKPFLDRYFGGLEIAFSYGDPAGNNRGEGEGKTAIGILNDKFVNNDDGDIIQPLNMGFSTTPAPTNDPTKRIDAVTSFLTKMTDGEPGMLLSKKCSILRKGFIGGYQYKRIQVAGESRYHEKPDKNHYSHCFVAGTLVSTNRGQLSIEDISVGDMVITPFGLKPVTATMNRYSNDLFEVYLNNGEVITCTGDHPFYTDHGKVRADALQYSDVLYSTGDAPEWAKIQFKSLTGLSFIKKLKGTIRRATKSMAIERSTCIDMCGNSITAKYLTDTMSITSTKTNLTTGLKTLNSWMLGNISRTIPFNGISKTMKNPRCIWSVFGRKLKPGIAQKKALSSIESLALSHGQMKLSRYSIAHGARKITSAIARLERKASVLPHVKEWPEKLAESMMSLGNAVSAILNLKPINTAKRKPALRVVQVKPVVDRKSKRVYDLTVKDAHCFYANGVLVSNCHDALQYLAVGFAGGHSFVNKDEEEYDDYYHSARKETWY
jgi:hypothetical protein